nr:RecName: Full=Lymna-DF-amide 2 [Lymnaea stagnalis]AAB26363.1 lymnaDFamide 2=neuropeptide homolog [Lymnaea stagnalis=snails, ganglia, Peptide, 13 aa] [Lymnaea stagnalis]
PYDRISSSAFSDF